MIATSAQEIVNYGVQPATQPIYIAKALGLLGPIEKKHNVKIEFKTFCYGAPQNQAMAAGELRMSTAGMGPAMIAASWLSATLVAITILEQTAILVPKDSSINSVGELKGKRIAFPGEGSQQYPLLLKALSDAGFDESDGSDWGQSGGLARSVGRPQSPSCYDEVASLAFSSRADENFLVRAGGRLR